SPEAVGAILARDVKELPTLPVVATKLLEITLNDDASAMDLSKVVETDPALTVKVLRIVNSAAYGFLREIASVHQAVALLGFSTIRTLALGVTLFEQMVGADRASRYDRIFFWQHCLSVAGLSMALAKETQYPDPEEAYVSGLLHDVGKIILDVYGRITYGMFLSSLTASDRLMLEQERKLIGLGHDDIGAYFCNAWDMTENLVLAIKFHHQPFSEENLNADQALLASIVSLADFIAWTQGLGSVNILNLPILQPEVEARIDLQQIKLQDMIARMDKEIKSTADFYRFSFPSSDQFRENLLRANIELGRINTKYYYLQDSLKNKMASSAAAARDVPAPAMEAAPETIISQTLAAIQNDFKFDRLYLMRVDMQTRRLTTVESVDTSTLGMDFSAFDIQLTGQSGGFLDCLRQCIPVLISGKTRGEKEVLDFLQVKEMGAVPVAGDSGIIGLLGMDNAFSGRPIQASNLASVGITANEMGRAMENMRPAAGSPAQEDLDHLTRVYNRAAIEKHLQQAFLRARTEDAKLSLAIIDLDFFKPFNERFGTMAGDTVLKLIAGTIVKLSRPTDRIGR
ncbi:MAG: HDOD domain-containing protein, partial [Desulfobacterales bacterium]|nr:HDOD domain-containing protein [Desulfobacterales bacterium]